MSSGRDDQRARKEVWERGQVVLFYLLRRKSAVKPGGSDDLQHRGVDRDVIDPAS